MIIKNAAFILLLLVVLGSIFMTTDPNNLPAAMFVAVFMLLYLLVVAVIFELLLVIKRGGFIKWTTLRMFRIAAIVAAFPVFMVVLQSIGQLTVRDILLSLALFLLAYVYFNRISPESQ